MSEYVNPNMPYKPLRNIKWPLQSRGWQPFSRDVCNGDLQAKKGVWSYMTPNVLKLGVIIKLHLRVSCLQNNVFV